MKQIKTILVPTDFSIPADYAVHYAMDFARVFDASVVLYHAFIPYESGFYPLAQSQKENLETEQNLLNRLNTIKEAVSRSHPGVEVTAKVDRGPESAQLLEYCRKKKFDLIVMGTKGASGLKEIVIGSFTADVMANANCPVLAIPEKFRFKLPKKMTYASDCNPKDLAALRYLLMMNERFNAKISILHIDSGKRTPESEAKTLAEHKKRIETKLAGHHFDFQHIAARDVSKAILETTAGDKTDLLAIGPQKRKGFWDRMLHKSVTKTTAHHILIPLLTVPLNSARQN